MNMRRNPFAQMPQGYARHLGYFADTQAPGQVPAGFPQIPGSPASALPPMDYGPQGGLAPAIQSSLEGILDPQLDGSDYFFYVTDSGSIAQNATTNSAIQIDAGTDFLWVATTYFAILTATAGQTAATLQSPAVTVVITDTGATKNLSNSPVPVTSCAGTGNFPYRLIEPRLFRANSTINFTWNNVEPAASTYTHVYFTMHGIRKIAGTFNLA